MEANAISSAVASSLQKVLDAGDVNGGNSSSQVLHATVSIECDCDSCLLGFDDTRPGQVLDEPLKRKKLAVSFFFLFFFFQQTKLCVTFPNFWQFSILVGER